MFMFQQLNFICTSPFVCIKFEDILKICFTLIVMFFLSEKQV